jgi:patatin-like phospholipase/acyl hydrolase
MSHLKLNSPSDLKNLHHQFDEVLAQTTGDITIVMKISTNQLLASKVLMMLKGLASHIKLSIDQI